MVIALTVWMVAATYLGAFALRGWIPHDEGTLAQTAERVLNGELSHRDFHDPYTGGTTYLHALAFHVLGVRLASIRWTLLAFALVFVAALYGIAARVARPLVAGLIVLLALVWSLPNYFAGLASWYILFCSVAGTWSLLRYIDTQRRGWLVVAGVCGGLGLLVKIVGLYYIAAALIFLAYRQACIADSARPVQKRGSRIFLVLVTLIALTLCALVVTLIRRHWGLMELIYYVLPVAALSAVLVWSEWRLGQGEFGARFRSLLGQVLLFAGGVVLPVALFLAPFAAGGGLDDLYRGVIVLPQKRLEHAGFPLPPVSALLTTLPLVLLLIGGFRGTSRIECFLLPVILVALSVLAYFGDRHVPYVLVWYSARCLTPAIVLVGCWLLVRGADLERLSPTRRQEVFLVLAMAALVSLIQFPYAFGIYFSYVAPLVVLAVYFVVASQPAPPKRLHACFMLFYFVFAASWLNTGFVRSIGLHYVRNPPQVPLEIAKAGLWVPARHKRIYETVVRIVLQHTEPGSYIYAGPDCPEVYFLSGTRNPTRTLYEFFDEQENRFDRITALLEDMQIKVVVLNMRPEFSTGIDERFLSWIRRHYPNLIRVGNFIIGWRTERTGGKAQLSETRSRQSGVG